MKNFSNWTWCIYFDTYTYQSHCTQNPKTWNLGVNLQELENSRILPSNQLPTVVIPALTLALWSQHHTRTAAPNSPFESACLGPSPILSLLYTACKRSRVCYWSFAFMSTKLTPNTCLVLFLIYKTVPKRNATSHFPFWAKRRSVTPRAIVREVLQVPLILCHLWMWPQKFRTSSLNYHFSLKSVKPFKSYHNFSQHAD